MDSTEKRVKRIIGQMRGIEKMVKDRRDCPEILQQISAVKKAIDGLTGEIVLLYILKYLPQDKAKEMERVVERVISI